MTLAKNRARAEPRPIHDRGPHAAFLSCPIVSFIPVQLALVDIAATVEFGVAAGTAIAVVSKRS